MEQLTGVGGQRSGGQGSRHASRAVCRDRTGEQRRAKYQDMTDHLPLIAHAPRATLRRAQRGLRHAQRWHYRRRRNGVLLLVVLTVLVLFVLLTVTYVIVATKERVTARAYSRYDQSGDPPNQIADSIAMTLFRDTTDVHSPFHTWSLLEGIYGNLSFRGNVGKQSRVCDGSGVGPAPTTRRDNSISSPWTPCPRISIPASTITAAAC